MTLEVPEIVRRLQAGDRIIVGEDRHLEILEADHRTDHRGDYDRSKFRARKQSGHVVDLREYNVYYAIEAGAQIEVASRLPESKQMGLGEFAS